jgi:hypothetical protein
MGARVEIGPPQRVGRDGCVDGGRLLREATTSTLAVDEGADLAREDDVAPNHRHREVGMTAIRRVGGDAVGAEERHAPRERSAERSARPPGTPRASNQGAAPIARSAPSRETRTDPAGANHAPRDHPPRRGGLRSPRHGRARSGRRRSAPQAPNRGPPCQEKSPGNEASTQRSGAATRWAAKNARESARSPSASLPLCSSARRARVQAAR